MQQDAQHLFYTLLARKKAGELTLEERLALTRLLQEQAKLAAQAQRVEEITLLEYNVAAEIGEEAINEKWQSLSQKIAPMPQKKLPARKIWIWTAAAACMISIMAGIYFVRDSAAVTDKQNIVSTKKGSKTKVVLPDGSLVALNGDSKLSYNENFGKNAREVTLSGEGYFEVVKNKKLPFIVHTANMDVKVLGTVFNVKAYPDDKSTEAVLIKGSVEVALKNNPDKKIILKPAEKLRVQNDYVSRADGHTAKDIGTPQIALLKTTLLPHDSAAIETQWIQNRLAFHKEKLENIAADLSRWYGARIIIKDEKIKANTYSGVFEDETIEQVLEALKLAGGFHYKNENKTITIYP